MIRRWNTMIGCRVVNGNHYFSLVRHERGVVLSRATNRRWHHSAFTSMDHCHSFSFKNRTHSRYRFGGNVGICGPAHNNTELSLSLRSFGYSSALSLPSTLRPSRSISTLISATSVAWPTTTTIHKVWIRAKSNKRKKRKQKEKQQRYNQWRKEETKKKRMKGLHPAAKMKRILSYCDNLFHKDNILGDPFYREELVDYHGHARISALANERKLEHWGDDPALICKTLRSEAANRKYKVVFNEEFVKAATRNRKRREIRQRAEESQQKKLEKKLKKEEHRAKKLRRRKLNRFIEDTLEEFWRRRYPVALQECLDEERAEVVKEREERASKMTWLERTLFYATNKWDDAKEWMLLEDVVSFHEIEKAKREKKRKQKASKMTWPEGLLYRAREDTRQWIGSIGFWISSIRNKIIGKIEDDDIDWDWYYHGEFYYELYEENPEFQEAVTEFEDLEQYFQYDYYNRKENFDYMPDIEDEREIDLRKIGKDGKIDLKIEAKDHKEDEKVSLPVVDDGSDDFYFALVRPKKLTPEDYTFGNYVEDDDYDDLYDDDLYGDDSLSDPFAFSDFWEDDDEIDPYIPPPEDPKPKKNKTTNLRKYSSERIVRVIKNAKQLNAFCRDLNESLNSNNTKDDVGDSRAVGFDVEYCSLEMDIRGTLPAMLQLASPNPKGPVGLIWLDKFPNHGKDMIGDPKYEDLLSILSSPDISKVGVGVTKDAKHLAAWWGISDNDHIDYYFSGMTDLESEFDDRVNEKTLQDMCESVLGRRLPKMKEQNAKKNKKKRKKGKKVKTSHWRRDDLTKDMKDYAADDASCSIDVWQHIQQTSTTSQSQ